VASSTNPITCREDGCTLTSKQRLRSVFANADVRRSGGKRREAPLFPGYLFCRALNCTHGLIVTTPGVRCVVSCDKQPVGVSETEIENIRLLVRSALPLGQWDSLEPGDEMQLISGPLAGCRGSVTHRAEGHHFVVSVEILRRSIAVKVEVDWIKPVPRLGPESESKCRVLAAAG
jgi:transcription antitermination factor NusG